MNESGRDFFFFFRFAMVEAIPPCTCCWLGSLLSLLLLVLLALLALVLLMASAKVSCIYIQQTASVRYSYHACPPPLWSGESGIGASEDY